MDCPEMRTCRPIRSPFVVQPADQLRLGDRVVVAVRMSSSRVHSSLTGVPGICLAMATAWVTKSWKAPRRPKPPPRWIL